MDTSPIANAVKFIAFYFPQFHAIPENDEWWGKGFTDWNNVRTATPYFAGHYQPRVPMGGRYYDQSQLDTLRWQIQLAKTYGLGGFCHYHYWFDGKQLLETPTNLVLDNPDLDLPFCLCWANETWSRRWDGRDHHILVLQTHKPDKALWKAHFDYLVRAWSDPRAITVDGKPLFMIYRPHRIQQMGEMFDFWRELAHRHGLKGIYFATLKQYEFPQPELLRHFDAVVKFQPFETIFSRDFTRIHPAKGRLIDLVRLLPQKAQNLIRAAVELFSPMKIHDYDQAWEHIIQRQDEPGMTTFEGAFVDWDNTARYKKRATVFKGGSPDRFGYWMEKLVDKVNRKPADQRMVFINAWNEWSESAYLEPDERHGYAYLEKIKALSSLAAPAGRAREARAR